MLFFAMVMSLFAVCMLLIYEAGLIYRQTERSLEKESRNLTEQKLIPFSKTDLTPHFNENIQIIQSTKNTRGIAYFQNSLFAATDGGLLQMNENGEIVRHFTVSDGLPESDLTTLAEFRSKLFIGTKSKGLIEFDGEKFSVYRLQNHETKTVITLLPTAQSILIGTFSGGLLEFDGAQLKEIKAAGERLTHITFLRETNSDLIVGTFADGLWIRQNQIWKHFRATEGLSSNRVVGAEIYEKNIFVATDLGVSQASLDEIAKDARNAFRRIFSLPTLSSLIRENASFYLTKDNGEIYFFSAETNPVLKKISQKSNENLQSAKLTKLNDHVFFLSNQGIKISRRAAPAATDEISLRDFPAFPVENELADNNISALAIDNRGRIWAGTFRDGIDIFSADGKKLKHIESENSREINYLTPKRNEVLAATSGGAIRFDEGLNEKPLVENSALPSRSVAQILLFDEAQNQLTAVATAKGLFFENRSARRVFSTVNGLPANSISSLTVARNSIFVGTMSGLAEIQNGRVRRVFKSSNSELKNNWVSAICANGERIFIGTYGGGIYELLPSGEIRAFEKESDEKVTVNPNALFADGENLYAGTLDGALRLDLKTGKLSKIADVLPSETVLSVTADHDYVYFGTTGGIARINKKFFAQN